MRNVPVAEAMTSHVTAVPAELTVAEVAEKMGNDGERAVVIVDTNGQLDGIATLRDVEAALLDNNPGLSISHAATRPVVTVFPDESLSHAAHRLGARSWPAAGRRARTRASDCRHAASFGRRARLQPCCLESTRNTNAPANVDRRFARDARGAGGRRLQWTTGRPHRRRAGITP